MSAVVDGAHAAGRTALLQHRGGAAHLRRHNGGRIGAANKGIGDILAVTSDHARMPVEHVFAVATHNLGGWPWDGQTTHQLGAQRQGQPLGSQAGDVAIRLRTAVVPALEARQACADKQWTALGGRIHAEQPSGPKQSDVEHTTTRNRSRSEQVIITEMSHFVLHVSQADRWPAALSNLANMTELGLADAITVMVNGTAIYAIQGTNDWTAAMERAAAAGVTFEVCSRSVANHTLPVETLPSWFRVVPAAIPAIAEYVRAGATYIKP